MLVALVSQQAPKSSPPTQDPCFRPLEEFCARSACLTYEEQVKTTRAGENCTATSFGKCGKLRVTYLSWAPFAAETRYFDKGGKLIAVQFDTDVYIGPACPNWIHYGAATKCQVTNVKLCTAL
jgi:hypothetical protein